MDVQGLKLHGVGPSVLMPDMMSMLYKYNSGSKAFSPIPTKAMSVNVDAVTLKDKFWKKKGSVL